MVAATHSVMLYLNFRYFKILVTTVTDIRARRYTLADETDNCNLLYQNN